MTLMRWPRDSSGMSKDRLSDAGRGPEREHGVLPVPHDIPQVRVGVDRGRVIVEESLCKVGEPVEHRGLTLLQRPILRLRLDRRWPHVPEQFDRLAGSDDARLPLAAVNILPGAR